MATTPLAATTPSPPPHIRTPPAPRLGFADSWEPFSPRKSSRIAAAYANSKCALSNKPAPAARTPSPPAATRRAVRQLRSPRTGKQTDGLPACPPQHLDAASFSPAPISRKRKEESTAHFLSPENTPSRRVGGGKTAAAAAASEFSRMGGGMLPTPAKTPSKKYHAASQNESNIAAVARNLFHHNEVDEVDEVMSSPSKKPSTPSRRPRKASSLLLESFTVTQDDEPMAIFTDSQDRVPEADCSAENPFFGSGAAAGSLGSIPAPRRSKRSHVTIPGEGKQTIEDATRREDGLVYVFRGKRFFRKFEDSTDAQEEDILDGFSSGKRLTRSAIKPRLLFPRDDSVTEMTPNGATTDDEEALTDIEDPITQRDEAELQEEDDGMIGNFASTSADLVSDAQPTNPPHTHKIIDGSPPSLGRSTRSGHKFAERGTPMKTAAATKKRSPFEGWRQTKSSALSAAGHKRPADALGSVAPAGEVKRSRA
ncbi:hypothetical protein SEPCBS119000_002780 [Sporothrix epigloea]|uniref:Uncharacterized protein n=1 Tax=Sporothrix epigloea TaxID=1892477 RepID=A0ABP0DI17_9PEZI